MTFCRLLYPHSSSPSFTEEEGKLDDLTTLPEILCEKSEHNSNSEACVLFSCYQSSC